MKFDPQKSFGYPVLRPGSNDYLDADFQSGIKLDINEKNETQYLISYDVAIGVKQIKTLIASGKAGVQIALNCRTTFYGLVHSLVQLAGQFSVEADQVRGALEISCYVTATKPITNFASEKINPEFGSASIKFPQYAVLACDAPIHYWVDREAFRNITSIFDWRKEMDLPEGVWRLDLEEDRVGIILSPTQLQIITQAEATKQNKSIILNSIIFGAVVEIINTLKSNNDYSERKWAKNVLTKCTALGITLTDTSNAIDIAQKLMAKPLAQLNSIVFKSGDDT